MKRMKGEVKYSLNSQCHEGGVLCWSCGVVVDVLCYACNCGGSTLQVPPVWKRGTPLGLFGMRFCLAA